MTNPTRVNDRPVLLTGASGYIGGHLEGALGQEGFRVRCLTRKPELLRDLVGPDAEVVGGDVLDPDSLPRALAGTQAAFYLVHAMGESGSFEETDRTGAGNFARAAREAGLERIVYLGGLAPDGPDLSAHMRSRHEVGDILRESGVPVIELRASIILGAGSLSFELMRALVERLPAMITPRWVSTPCQPIAIDDVLQYLVAALSLPGSESRIYEVGGSEVLSFGDLMRRYGELRGLDRPMVPVPLLTPRLSGMWLELVAPEYARVGRSLIDSVEHASVVRDPSASQAFSIRPIGARAAIARALRIEDDRFRETPAAQLVHASATQPGRGGFRLGSRYVAVDEAEAKGTPQAAFEIVSNLGGEAGWVGPSSLGGMGATLRRWIADMGLRPHDEAEADGTASGSDFWRIDALERDRRLRLAAEMKVPGRAWLEFEIAPAIGGSTIRQTTIFEPRGLTGIAYWQVLYPLHQVIFRRLLEGIAVAVGASKKPPPKR